MCEIYAKMFFDNFAVDQKECLGKIREIKSADADCEKCAVRFLVVIDIAYIAAI